MSDERSKSLLTWATSQSNSSTTPSRPLLRPEQIQSQWVDAIMGESEVIGMKRLIKSLSDTSLSAEAIVAMLVEIECSCELTHNANDFAKIGGLPLINRLVTHHDANVRCHSLSIIGICLPNNTEFQTLYLAEDGLRIVLRIFHSDPNVRVRGKALLSLSGLVRNSSEALREFVKADGSLWVVRSLSDSVRDDRIVRRAVFFLDYLFANDDTAIDIFISNQGCSRFAEILRGDDIDMIEKAVGSLLTLVESSKQTLYGALGSSAHMIVSAARLARRNEIARRQHERNAYVNHEDDVLVNIDRLLQT